jgi:hypothetical protein
MSFVNQMISYAPLASAELRRFCPADFIRRAKIMFAASLLSLLSIGTARAGENYCQDPEANRQWLEMLARTPDDPLIIKLFALRSGLCVLVEQRLIALDQATDIFEQERSEAMTERHREEQERRFQSSGTTCF